MPKCRARFEDLMMKDDALRTRLEQRDQRKARRIRDEDYVNYVPAELEPIGHL